MIWLTWRQHRMQALFGLLGLAAVAALIVPTGLRMHDKFKTTGLADCLERTGNAEFVPLNRPGSSAGCVEADDEFMASFGSMQLLAVLFVFLPLLVGLFFGAPLIARELEHGTHRLVWTQGVARSRWAAVKIGLVGAAALLLAAGYAALLTWWIRPLNGANGSRFDVVIFDLQGVVPLAYTVFAVALGVFAGTVTRKVLPAMAITLGGFVAARLLVAGLARPHFLPQKRREVSVVSDVEPNRYRGDWILSSGVYDGSGKRLVSDGSRFCSPTGPRPRDTCDPAIHNVQIFQPAGRFWTFQWIETGLYAALAVLLIAFAVHRIRRLS